MDLPSFLSSVDPKVAITAVMALFASMTTMIGARKFLSIDNFESFLTMRLARLGVLILSPLLYPYFVGRRMLFRINRSLTKSKRKFAQKRLKKADAGTEEFENYALNVRKADNTLSESRKTFYAGFGNEWAMDDPEWWILKFGAWLLGAIPIALIAVVTWVPGAREIDLGVTETLTQGLRTAGEFLVSMGGK